jgi:hypothetical protein
MAQLPWIKGSLDCAIAHGIKFGYFVNFKVIMGDAFKVTNDLRENR